MEMRYPFQDRTACIEPIAIDPVDMMIDENGEIYVVRNAWILHLNESGTGKIKTV